MGRVKFVWVVLTKSVVEFYIKCEVHLLRQYDSTYVASYSSLLDTVFVVCWTPCLCSTIATPQTSDRGELKGCTDPRQLAQHSLTNLATHRSSRICGKAC
jgi:hypothetical protein